MTRSQENKQKKEAEREAEERMEIFLP